MNPCDRGMSRPSRASRVIGRRSGRSFVRTMLLIAAVVMLAPLAGAQPSLREPGSVLVFPLFDSSPGAATVIHITNTNRSTTYCEQTDELEGNVVVEYRYVDSILELGIDPILEEIDAGGTISVIADRHASLATTGYLVVTALDPTTREPADFDWLIGSAIVTRAGLNQAWKYTPYAFRSIPESADPCDLTPTDVDGDFARDFDGVEYDAFPDRLVLDSFFQERDPFENELVLMSFVPTEYVSRVSFLFWANIEVKFSRQTEFRGWRAVPLSSISAIAENLGGDREELGIDEVELGYLTVRGTNVVDDNEAPVPELGRPAILGMFVQTLRNRSFAVGSVLHGEGALDGLEFPEGDLDPQSPVLTP